MREAERPLENSSGKNAVLILRDGSVFHGKGFGAEKQVAGEVVFNTSMFGYPELLTDPSYYEQIVAMTYPIIGSYGVPRHSIRDEHSIPLHFESDSIKIKGYAVHTLSRPSHWASEKPLDEWLEEDGVPGIEGIDTRALTKKLRANGTMLGLLKVTSDEVIDESHLRELAKELEDPNKRNLVTSVSTREPVEYLSAPDTHSQRVVLIDCGTKNGILRCLLDRGIDVVRVPYNSSSAEIMAYRPSGIVISNGPGDPKMCGPTIESTRQLIDQRVPILGICLGMQIIGLAAGGETYKLKFGHRAVNHPCIDLETGRCYITTQNHGYTVKPGSLDNTSFKVSHVNANDKTVEGIRDPSRDIVGVQWHPESSPGPYDTGFLFEDFVRKIKMES